LKCSGIIKKILLVEGFGFIKQENNKPDVFFHKSKNSLFPNLKKGDLVEFDEVSSKKGMAAENI
jgi:cold shock CspA family protein